jgi:hypothetical protein
MENMFVQGRVVTPEQLDWIRGLMRAHPDWGRYRLSQHIAQQWDWRNAVGQLKDMAARTMLLKLERRSLLALPARQLSRSVGSRKAVPANPAEPSLFTEPPIGGPLQALGPLTIQLVDEPALRQRLRQVLSAHHYLGYQRAVGQNLSYLVWDRHNRLLAALVFGAAAWKCASRDLWIGWNQLSRQAHLHHVVNNMRFMILPWVKVPGLGSHLLGAVARRLVQDWPQKYGHPIYLLETFVERDRFEGTCYRGANWIWVGQTQGRSRNDTQRSLQVPCKDVFVYPLVRNCRSSLQEHSEPMSWRPSLKNFPSL